MEPSDRGRLQARPSPDEREAVIERLTRAYADDLLDIDEFDRRAAAAYAETSRHALVALVADLPAPPEVQRTPAGAQSATEPERISAFLSSVDRRGMTVVPRHLEIRTVLGSVELDLSRATFLPGITEIVIRTFLGSVEIILPPDVNVENHGSAFLSSFECHAHATFGNAPRPVTTVRITGRAVLGSVEID